MVHEFKVLTERETELMFKAPFLVCILIASADGTIDRKEIKEAIRITDKKYRKSDSLRLYFEELSQDFEDKLKILIQGYPYESTQRSPLIVSELAELNAVLPKLTRAFSLEFYQALKDIAVSIAASSGGMLGIQSIASEEAKYIQLNMIQNPATR
jgi:hypothetical protein